MHDLESEHMQSGSSRPSKPCKATASMHSGSSRPNHAERPQPPDHGRGASGRLLRVPVLQSIDAQALSRWGVTLTRALPQDELKPVGSKMRRGAESSGVSFLKRRLRDLESRQLCLVCHARALRAPSLGLPQRWSPATAAAGPRAPPGT